AEQRNAPAQCSLGTCYYNGDGVKKDFTKAVEWFSKAAEQRNAPAQCSLGTCYYNGDGVKKDLVKAVEWYSKAAEQGNTVAQYNLGVCYDDGDGVEKDFTKAVEWYTKAAEQGHISAQYNLGICYKNGNGVEKDLTKAVEWFTKAAEQGHASAQNNLGICFKNGNGVEKDLAKAVEWYTKAAEQGQASAQYNLGICYYNGVGAEKDLAKAVEWFTKAAEQGDEDAKIILNRLKSFDTKPIHYLFFDTETTGLPIDYYTPTYQTKLWPRLVQLSWITTDENCNIISQNDFIIYPEGFTIPSDASKLHGITTNIAKEKGKPLKEVMDKFMEDFKVAKVIVGHNIDFDKKILSAELYRMRQRDIMNNKKTFLLINAMRLAQGDDADELRH
ncbi:MAG: SEL1-like repeat protein, partial [Muribaculaceae bacterium]|nr:SEL1-like repeat protein [Muribaculaceae bacterium]